MQDVISMQLRTSPDTSDLAELIAALITALMTPLAGLAFAYWSFGVLWG
jgi:hypothetical protein